MYFFVFFFFSNSSGPNWETSQPIACHMALAGTLLQDLARFHLYRREGRGSNSSSFLVVMGVPNMTLLWLRTRVKQSILSAGTDQHYTCYQPIVWLVSILMAGAQISILLCQIIMHYKINESCSGKHFEKSCSGKHFWRTSVQQLNQGRKWRTLNGKNTLCINVNRNISLWYVLFAENPSN